MNKSFSDRVDQATKASGSILVAGIDPDLEQIPTCFLEQATQATSCDEDFFEHAIRDFYISALVSIRAQIAAVKLNLAFFERYGMGGLRAYLSITAWCREHALLVIADAKRGDIGSTATAYAHAFLARSSFKSHAIVAFEADALTVNPFLGFDTLVPFLEIAAREDKGLFILARTSNPGSADLQSISTGKSDRFDISSLIADWINAQANSLMGICGISGLGAVVGATRPEELVRLRQHMPRSLFLVPGFGAQGGTATDIAGARTSDGCGILVNSSRGLFGNLAREFSKAEVTATIAERVRVSNQELVVAGPIKKDE